MGKLFASRKDQADRRDRRAALQTQEYPGAPYPAIPVILEVESVELRSILPIHGQEPPMFCRTFRALCFELPMGHTHGYADHTFLGFGAGAGTKPR